MIGLISSNEEIYQINKIKQWGEKRGLRINVLLLKIFRNKLILSQSLRGKQGQPRIEACFD